MNLDQFFVLEFMIPCDLKTIKESFLKNVFSKIFACVVKVYNL